MVRVGARYLPVMLCSSVTQPKYIFNSITFFDLTERHKERQIKCFTSQGMSVFSIEYKLDCNFDILVIYTIIVKILEKRKVCQNFLSMILVIM